VIVIDDASTDLTPFLAHTGRYRRDAKQLKYDFGCGNSRPRCELTAVQTGQVLQESSTAPGFQGESL
jgi:hypothetical protein